MPDKPSAGLLKVAREETAFRKQVTGYIAGVLRSNAPTSIKVYIIIDLSLFVLISFDILFLIINVIHANIRNTEVNFALYVVPFFVMCCGMIGPGIPLVMRMSSAEQSSRLEGEFREVAEKKKLRSRGPQVVQETS